jgi:hypothetical protein
MKEIANIEAARYLQAAEEVHEDYQDMLPDFKLTFEAVYAVHAEDADDTSARVDDCMDIFLAIEKDAIATFPSEVAAEAAAAAAAAPAVEAAVEAAPAVEAVEAVAVVEAAPAVEAERQQA